jgi:hypothetical protein
LKITLQLSFMQSFIMVCGANPQGLSTGAPHGKDDLAISLDA